MQRHGLRIQSTEYRIQTDSVCQRKRSVSEAVCLLTAMLMAVFFTSCEGTTFQSSVPTYPVRFTINTNMGEFVHFKTTAQNDYVTLCEDGYRYNGKWILARPETDAYGYAGTVVFVSVNGYDAYDLACPYCAAHGLKIPCDIDGIFAVCPHCGEHYDLGSGTAAPQKGISKEFLRRYAILNSDGKLTVTQQ